MYNEVIGIRTNTWTKREEEMYNQLKQVFSPEQIFVIVDEMKGTVTVPEGIQKISWNGEFISKQGLLHYTYFHRGVGWLCGDYFYYAFYQAVLADYYWLIEPDVSMTFTSWKHDFFDYFDGIVADAFLVKFRSLLETEYWYASGRLIGEEVYGCLFPLSRLSYQAIQCCFLERQRISILFNEHQSFSNLDNKLGIHFPNDESLISTTLAREGFLVRDFSEILPDVFEFFDYHHWIELPVNKPLRPVNQVIHPVRTADAIASRLFDKIIKNLYKDSILFDMTVSSEGAQMISEKVGSLVSSHIRQVLGNSSQFVLDFADLKGIVRQAAISSPKPYYCWTFGDNVFVVEAIVDGERLVTEFVLEDEMVTCFSFSRSLPDWGKQVFHSYYPDMEVQGCKIKHFSLQFVNITDLKPFIEAALNNFFAVI